MLEGGRVLVAIDADEITTAPESLVKIVASVAFFTGEVVLTRPDGVCSASRSGTVEEGTADCGAKVTVTSLCQGTARVSNGVTPAEVVINATAPARTKDGTDGANVATGATIGPSSGPIKGIFAKAASGPAIRFMRPTETANIARTTVGSNCEPAPLSNSRRATSIEYGFLYERAIVITANASATETMRPVREIASPARP